MTVTAQVAPTEIIGQDNDDVRSLHSWLVLAAVRTARVAFDDANENDGERRENNQSHDFRLRSGCVRRVFSDYRVATSGWQAGHIPMVTSTLRPAPTPCGCSNSNTYVSP